MRGEITAEQVDSAIHTLLMFLDKRIEKHGNLSYGSIHEILGLITEEYHELVEAVKKNDHTLIEAEIADIGVICLIAISAIQQKTLDW